MKISEIKSHLNNNVKILIYDVLESSNETAKELANGGGTEFTTVIAKSQTRGKGRLGRSFISKSENGLYMSVIFRPEASPDKCTSITALASVAVLEAIKDTTDLIPSIKWVNDIYINDKKVCGILTEASFDNDKLSYVIVGIGVNISKPENGFDAEIENIATSIFEGDAPDGYKELLCARVIDNLIYYYSRMNDNEHMEAYKSHSNIIGKEVDVYRGNEIIKGVAVDIGNNAELIVKDENGDICVFNSGEARVRKSGVSLS